MPRGWFVIHMARVHHVVEKLTYQYRNQVDCGVWCFYEEILVSKCAILERHE
jgi:hypothetical protein